MRARSHTHTAAAPHIGLFANHFQTLHHLTLLSRLPQLQAFLATSQLKLKLMLLLLMGFPETEVVPKETCHSHVTDSNDHPVVQQD
jgi:hypothetical protein